MRTLHERVARWPLELQEEWHERAAIIEHDGGLTKERAERRAFLELARKAPARQAEFGLSELEEPWRDSVA